MLYNIFTATLRDRVVSMLVAALALSLFVALGVALYSDVAEEMATMMEQLPDAVLAVMGTAQSSPADFVLSQLINLIAPFVFCGLAISIGTASIAGEERMNTMTVLLGNPQSRGHVLLSKACAMLLLTLTGVAALWGGTKVVLSMSASVTNAELLAGSIHLAALALFFGSFAIFIGAWTGSQIFATTASVGLLVSSWLATAILPLVKSLAVVAKLFPWYYFSASQPLVKGVDLGHVALLLGLSILCVVGALIGLQRRDIKFGEPSLLEKLKGHPKVAKAFERLSGGTLVSNVALRSFSEMQTLALVVAFYAALMSFIMGPLFEPIRKGLEGLSDKLPDAMKTLIGSADMATPEGWYFA